MTKSKFSTKYLVEMALLVAIILLMAFTPIGYIKTAGLEITLIVIPVAVGAVTLGPAAGAILGGVFGITSFIQCFGMSAFGTLLLGVNPVFTFLVCVPTRILDGWLTGLIYAGLKEENVAEVLAAADGRTLSGKGRMRRLYVACASEATGWTAVGVAYTQELLRSQDRIYKTYLLIAAAALILALVFALQLSRSIAGPIRRLMQTMRRVEDGDLHVRSQVSSRTELGQLSDSFDHMIAKTAELMDERLRSEEQKRKSEWKALQAQIQPHFLYNTLDSIIWMSHAGRNAEVVEMTSALALLLRSSIGDGSDTNTLKKEIAHVRSYLTIQKMRYNEKLRYEIDLDPQTEDCLLPKLILQPLVENAIYHGIKVKQQGGTVRIESLLEEDRLLITVEDDGVGMTPEQLAMILEKKEADGESSKIGVCNVNERLQLFFGSEAAMKYYSEPGKRTMVMLVLPIVREKGDADAEA